MRQIKTAKKKKTGNWEIIYRNRYIYLMTVPVILWYLIFAYIPMYGLTLAFKTFEPGGVIKYMFGGKWVGLEYFGQIMSDPLFYRAIKNTLIISAMKLSVSFPFVIFLVMLLNELKLKRFKKLTQTVMYLPHFFSWVIIGAIMVQLLSTNGGVIPNVMAKFNGGEKVSLLTSEGAFRWILVISSLVKEMGWSTIIYLSAIAGIPSELYEAASIDGASRLRRVFSITLPCLMPTIMTMLLIQISYMINGDFDQVYILYNSSVYNVADIIETYLYRIGLTSGKFGLATAMGLVKAVVSILMLWMANGASKRITGETLW